MIYLIRSAAVIDESIPSFEFILKIGYCRDNPNNSIFNRKKTLFTISGGTEQNNKTQGLNPYY